VRQLIDAGVVEVEWGVFSLSIVNFEKDMSEFDPDRARGVNALRTAIQVRSTHDNSTMGLFYSALAHRIFDGLEKPDELATLEAALNDVDLDPMLAQEALGDISTWETLRDEHAALCADCKSFGVPTIQLDNGAGPSIFGPVISNEPADEKEAVELWEHVSWLTRYTNFSELKRDRLEQPDLAMFRQRA
jgi:hypothetical protein